MWLRSGSPGTITGFEGSACKGDKDRLKMKEWGEISNLRFNAVSTKRWKSVALVCLSVYMRQIEKLKKSSCNLILKILNKSTNHFSFSKTNCKGQSTVSWPYLDSNWLNIYRSEKCFERTLYRITMQMFVRGRVRLSNTDVSKGLCSEE